MEGGKAIQFELHPILAKRTQKGLSKIELQYFAGITIKDALASIIPSVDLKSVIIVVNNNIVDPNKRLHPGDLVKVVLAIAGG